MDSQEIINRVLSGENIVDVINEITKSSDIATIKRPVGIIKKKRKKDKEDECK